jgi:DNA invertase Pin-like site-specific DNA recombinase
MGFYGYVRCSLLKREKPPEVQIADIAAKAEELGGSLTGLFVDPHSHGKKTAVLDRPAGKEMLITLQPGDTLIVNRLDRLGYSMPDVRRTVETLCERGVRIYILDALHGELDLSPAVGKTLLQLFGLQTKTEKTLRSERLTESAQWRKTAGLAYCNPPIARKIVEKDGLKLLVWDEQQLRYIAEIAERLPKEGAAKVAKDFWERGVKDLRGRPWGRQTPKAFSRYRSPYQQFYRAARWFHRAKRKGLLPFPYGALALLIPEPPGFREEPKPKKWTPGGTARREREQAAAKAQHHAERLLRWEKQKAQRIKRRVHKPKVIGQGSAPVLGE